MCEVKTDHGTKNFIFIFWSSPPDGWVKVNYDSSILASKKASCRGQIRDAMGEFNGGFIANLCFYPITVVELWGLFYSLDLTWKKDYRQVLLEVDSTYAIQLVQNGVQEFHLYVNLIRKIRELINRDWKV